jgi:sigma-E factor negative regulatory protein RseC
MIEEPAVVVDVSPEGTVLLEKPPGGNCGTCASPCLTLRAGYVAKGRLSLRVASPDSFKPGDRVVMGLAETAVLTAAIRLYLLPVAGLLLGALAGHQIARLTGWIDDAASAAGALGGLLLVLRSIRLVAGKNRADEVSSIVVRRIP